MKRSVSMDTADFVDRVDGKIASILSAVSIMSIKSTVWGFADGQRTFARSFRERFFQLFGKRRQNLKQVSADAVVGLGKYGRFGVFVD